MGFLDKSFCYNSWLYTEPSEAIDDAELFVAQEFSSKTFEIGESEIYEFYPFQCPQC